MMIYKLISIFKNYKLFLNMYIKHNINDLKLSPQIKNKRTDLNVRSIYKRPMAYFKLLNKFQNRF